MIPSALWFGDNLEILQHIGSETVDLIYLDPPFNSNRTYNVLFKERSGGESPAQIQAFEDTWSWDQIAIRALDDLTMTPTLPATLRETVAALYRLVGRNDMMAYLLMMTQRLLELHRVLKPTGSLYLHCDPTASHYLKIILDTIFGAKNFLSEISWTRTSAHNDAKQGRRNFGHVRDVILFSAKSDQFTWNVQFTPYSDSYINDFYRHVEPNTGRRYRLGDLTGPGGASKGNPAYEVMGVTRYWHYSKQRMNELIAEGRIIQTRPGAVPAYKRYLDEMPGVPLQDSWTDIRPIGSQAKERLGYPTQKPLVLLERIIATSSNPGDLVLDPFCGCGTAIVAAEKLGRRWIGIDVTHLAIDIMKRRLASTFPGIKFEVNGLPRDPQGARQLAKDNPYDFQWWAISLIDAVPREGRRKKGRTVGSTVCATSWRTTLVS